MVIFPKNTQGVLNISGGSLDAKKALIAINPKLEWFENDQVEANDQSSFSLNASNSAQLRGLSSINTEAPRSNVAINLSENSRWKITGDSQLDSLSVNNSAIEFEKGTAFHTLTVNGDLSGNNGIFYMNTNLAAQQSDKLVVNGSVSGSHQVSVADSRNEPNAANGKVTLIQTNGGAGSLKMIQPYVDAGVIVITSPNREITRCCSIAAIVLLPIRTTATGMHITCV